MSNSKYKTSVIRQKRQTGSVLLWGLIILLTLTVIGVSAARMGVTDIRIAGNQIFGTMTYQSAESGLERASADKFYIDKTDKTDEKVISEDFQDGGGATESTVTISMDGLIQCPAIEGISGSIEMNSEKFSCLLVVMDARARLPGTGTNSRHSQGVVTFTPADESSL